MTNNNRKVGTTFEKQLCLSLAGYGFWAHNLAQNSQGQPFDVMASRNGMTHPIDCKDCANNVFKLARVEENQASAMTLWRETGNGEGWFALRLSNSEVWFVPFSEMEKLMWTKSVISLTEIKVIGIPLGKWVEQCK